MDYEIKKRVLTTADIFLRDRSTVREVAKLVDCSKSTVHKDLTERLPEINQNLYIDVKSSLNIINLFAIYVVEKQLEEDF